MTHEFHDREDGQNQFQPSQSPSCSSEDPVDSKTFWQSVLLSYQSTMRQRGKYYDFKMEIKRILSERTHQNPSSNVDHRSTPPQKMKINYNLIQKDPEAFLSEIKEAIMINLYLNRSFAEGLYVKTEFKEFFELISQPYLDDQTQAQLTIVLHVSKNDDIQAKDLSSFSSINLIDIYSPEELGQFNMIVDAKLGNLFNDIIHSDLIRLIVTQTINFILLESDNFFELSKLGLKWFESSITGLSGFSGIDKVYVNGQKIKFDFVKIKAMTSEQIATVVMKLEFVRIVTHEITHVVLRQLTGDINDSTPLLKRGQIAIDHPESGIMAEVALFGGKINFLETIKKASIDFDYGLFQKMFDDIMIRGQRVLRNDTIVYVSPDRYSCMAVDFLKSDRIYEG